MESAHSFLNKRSLANSELTPWSKDQMQMDNWVLHDGRFRPEPDVPHLYCGRWTTIGVAKGSFVLEV